MQLHTNYHIYLHPFTKEPVPYLFTTPYTPALLSLLAIWTTTNIYCLSCAETGIRNLPIKVEEHENFK